MAAKLKIKRSTQTNRKTDRHRQKDSRGTMTTQKQNQKNYTTERKKQQGEEEDEEKEEETKTIFANQ